MTTLVLQAAGTALGTLVAGPVGGLVGGAIGAGLGGMVDSAVLGRMGGTRRIEGPRLSTLPGISSAEGTPLPRVYGRARLGGQVIWATRFVEEVSVRKTKAGGKGGGGQKVVTTTYAYYANLAVGLCEGPIGFVRRVWADGRELDLTGLAMRVYRGGEDQQPDPLIVAKEGSGTAPAYRGTAYVVFERMPLADFGNRLPQLSFEVVRPVGGVGPLLKAIHVIPGAGEFVYHPDPVTRVAGSAWIRENTHVLTHSSDWRASMDALQGVCPNLQTVSLVVSWFGDDLRLDRCTVAPRVEESRRSTRNGWWVVNGMLRAQARTVSLSDGRPAYGGTPSDMGVHDAIRDLRARGLGVTLYPFLMMDVPAGNGLPDPWTGQAGQPAYPWRGRITCDPAPGRPGSPDGTAAVAAQVARFFGTARPEHFGSNGPHVVYSGPAEWSLRRQVLHYARLASLAGGVDAFVIGSELVSLTRLRSGPGVYPAVAELVRLAADVRSMLGPETKLVYAADWTEYGAHVPAPGEVRFPLDPLWASPFIDAVGIDAWWPLTDWRDGRLHLDAREGGGPADPATLLAGTAGGEAYDWYYPDEASRAAQRRSPITDGLGEPWVFRQKDVANWWAHRHVERVGGAPAGPTAWMPGSKPVWLTEFGCPAVDRGGNGPNAFPDPKSAEARLPPFSSGTRDDLVQARALQAMLRRFDPAVPGHTPAPTVGTALDPSGMVPPGRMYAWCWDARPFPAFPGRADVWADASAWRTGHWLTGRLEGMEVARLVEAVLADHGLSAGIERVDGFCDGYVIDRPMSLRAALEPLATVFGFDLAAGADGLRFVGRAGAKPLDLTEDDLVPGRDGALVQRSRGQETELPRVLTLSFADGERDYSAATESSRRLAGASRRETALSVAACLPREEAARLADIALHEAWAGRETAEFSLRPGLVALEPGDLVRLPPSLGGGLMRIERIQDSAERRVAARAAEPGLHDARAGAASSRPAPAPVLPGPAQVVVVDWPAASGEPAILQSLALAASPWPGPMAVWRSADGRSFDVLSAASVPARIGRTLADLRPGPLWRFDDAAALDVSFDGEGPSATGDLGALDGSASLLVRHASGAWEIVGFGRCELVAARTWRLTRLLRGLGGGEGAAAAVLPAGSTVVVLDASLVAVAAGASSLGGTWRYRVGPAARDVGDPLVEEITATPGPAALRPLAPVRLSARRTAEGIALSWIRRGRIDADAWEPTDIPLGEAAEAYAVEILAGEAVRRAFTCAAPRLLYPAVDELADFGARQTSLRVRVAQVSAVVGPGTAATATLNIP